MKTMKLDMIIQEICSHISEAKKARRKLFAKVCKRNFLHLALVQQACPRIWKAISAYSSFFLKSNYKYRLKELHIAMI